MNHQSFRTTVSCHARTHIFVADQWFRVEEVDRQEGDRTALVVTKRGEGLRLYGRNFVEGERTELFPDVFLTVTDVSKRSKVRLCIEVLPDTKISCR